MIKVFKWWWAWEYEKIEDWLERMEAGGLRLVETRLGGIYFCFEKCVPTKARYCVDFQSKLTPEYMTIIHDDGWKLYQLKMGWYLLRKEYEGERPNLYNDFEGLLIRNRVLLTIVIVGLIFELIAIGNMVWDLYRYYDDTKLAATCILGAFVIALFSFFITNLSLQMRKFSKKQ